MLLEVAPERALRGRRNLVTLQIRCTVQRCAEAAVDVFAEHGNVVGGFFEQILMVHFSDSDFKFLIA